jgi:TonB family protein
MSVANSGARSLRAGRRSYARRRMDGLAYVEFGPDNGAILIDLGEGGLSFQSVMPVNINQTLRFKFKLPGADKQIEGSAEVTWMNESGKGGGLRFVELTTDACGQIREWTGVLPAPEINVVEAEAESESNPAKKIVAESAPADSADINSIPESVENVSEAPAPAPEPLATLEIAQAATPTAPTDQAALTDETAAKPITTNQVASPRAPAIPEFTVESAATSDWTQPAISVARVPDLKASESAGPHESKTADETAAAKMAAGRAMPPTPAKSTRMPAPDSKISAPVQKRRKPAPPASESPAPAAYQDSVSRGSFTRQAPASALPSTYSESPLADQADELRPQATLPAQAIRIGIGAAAGACLILALVFGLPHLRTLAQASANARLGGPNLATPAAFQVEVADLNDHRWILTSGGEAGSPFNNTPSRREASARSQSPKSSQSDASDDSSKAEDTPKPKFAKRGELALSRPRQTQTPVASAQLIAPSIFDGITPPIGSIGDRLAAGGPEAPRIVPPASQPRVVTSNLQAAVLLQRIAPTYPAIALAVRLQGEVQVNATIGKDGVPKDLKVVKGDQRLVPAALAAIGQWRYRAATLGGEPIETQILISVDFHLQ